MQIEALTLNNAPLSKFGTILQKLTIFLSYITEFIVLYYCNYKKLIPLGELI